MLNGIKIITGGQSVENNNCRCRILGYVGLSWAVLLDQNHEVTAITTTEAKAEELNQSTSPLQDDEIEWFLPRQGLVVGSLIFITTTDKEVAHRSVELVIIATPTNYDDMNHFFDTSAVEDIY